jgi:hypothetical protein
VSWGVSQQHVTHLLMPAQHPDDDPDFPDQFLLLRQLFREVARVAPGHGGGGMTGFTLHVPPEDALLALQALPDGAGLDAVLRAMGHEAEDA